MLGPSSAPRALPKNEGDRNDPNRSPAVYDTIHAHLRECGIRALEDEEPIGRPAVEAASPR